ncbi:hypothetical protein CEXT_437911 [Caerostris extrusa]|uniref:Uncharacterized protein n=1 Tax=Caerostris extrusa TaxID=172846 RepID=A0AAV4YBP7_CAEEX|nr:hypothetical protein CEXT_437911 [Caerostris extrusa]
MSVIGYFQHTSSNKQKASRPALKSNFPCLQLQYAGNLHPFAPPKSSPYFRQSNLYINQPGSISILTRNEGSPSTQSSTERICVEQRPLIPY